ncbi:MAG: bacillithiol biosynthesis deacetylase BshB1 [Planctomycetota bacterium]|nr:bacillithiol biosynthesis deacetylase BshB1 [Planctomycetota bacterium]
MKDPLDLLVVAAHPDDAEISVGGTILVARALGLRVGVLDLTSGEAGTRGSRQERNAETEFASRRLDLTWRGNLDLGDAHLTNDVPSRKALAMALAQLRPTTVLGHTAEDLHPDHAAAGALCRDACFLAGLTKFVDGPAHRPRRLLQFLSHEVRDPDFVVDVSAVWPRKLEAIRSYASQLTPKDGSDPGEHLPTGSDIVGSAEAKARFWGARIGVAYGEALLSPRPLEADVGTLFPTSAIRLGGV